MSLTSLKRTLAQMDSAQMAELIIDLYKARKEAKDYLDFFVDPDLDRRVDKAKVAVYKELARSAKGRNRARITRVTKVIKEIASLNPGAETVIELMTYAVETAALLSADSWVKETTQKGVAKLLTQTIQLADREGLLSLALPRLQRAVDGMSSDRYYHRSYKRLLAEALQESLG